jgi:hypothetical protein
MRMLVPGGLLLVFLAACAGPRETAQTAPGQDYQGEVVAWDTQRRTITLLRGAQALRVRVGTDEMNGLRMHEFRTVHGVAEGPVSLEETTRQGPAVFAPGSPAQEINVTGTVAAIDPSGVLTIQAAGQAVQVWTAQPGTSQFKVGDVVQARITVQPGTLVPASGAATAAAPGALAGTEPGDYAVFVGRVITHDPAGTIVIDTPRGTNRLPVPPGERQWTGQMVEVHSAVHPAK